MKVGVLCEFSGVVRDAFTAAGHDAVSCDLLESETPGDHIVGDLRCLDWSGFDLLVAFPPCVALASSGARWFKYKVEEQREAVEFVQHIMDLPVPRIAVENPIGVLSTKIRKPDQIIQPWQFGHGETKATCLWLQSLPRLVPTDIVEGREPRIHRMSPGLNRSRERSRTYTGIATAMAQQWGGSNE